MKTLAQFGDVLLLVGATLAYYGGLAWRKEARREAALEDPRHLYRRPRERLEPSDDEWCPAHDAWYDRGDECPACRAEWLQTWTLGEDPADIARRDDWSDQLAEMAAYDAHELSDGWYQDLVNRASFPGFDPHSPERGL